MVTLAHTNYKWVVCGWGIHNFSKFELFNYLEILKMTKKTATQDDGLIVVTMLVALVVLMALGFGMAG